MDQSSKSLPCHDDEGAKRCDAERNEREKMKGGNVGWLVYLFQRRLLRLLLLDDLMDRVHGVVLGRGCLKRAADTVAESEVLWDRRSVSDGKNIS